MPSNGLSSRRRYLRRPKVCKSAPNPGRCHPPPPLPPPPDFPPTCLDVTFSYWFATPGDPAFQEWTVEICGEPGTGWYWALDIGPDNAEVLLQYTSEWTFVKIEVTGQTPMGSGYHVLRNGFPVHSPPEDFYACAVWDVVDGVIAPVEFSFTI